MTTEADNEWWNSAPPPIRWLIFATVLSLGGSGYLGLTADTSDRYHATTAIADNRAQDEHWEREFKVRDARITSLEKGFSDHLQHSARWTEVIKSEREQAHAAVARLRQLEREFLEHMRENH